MEEILHQLIGGKYPIIYRGSAILLVVQDFLTIHSIIIISIYLSIYLSVCLSIYLSIYIYIYISSNL